MSQKDSQIKSEKGDLIPIGILLKFIKPFDGTREKLNSFITNCDNALELANDSQQLILFKYILAQLEGKAEIACSIKEFESWDQLSKFLQTQFGERKHYAHLLTDLQECRQTYNEQVNQFALRVETCLSKLLTEVTLSNKKKSELSGRIAAMEDLALHTFLLGLKPEISNLVRGKYPPNLNEAINLAISEEKILNLFAKRSYQSTPSQRQSSKPHNPYKSPTAPVSSQALSPRQFNFNTQSAFCRYCRIQGHTIENCRKREYNNNRLKTSQTSQFKPYPNQGYQKQNFSRINFAVDNNNTPNLEPQSTTSLDNEYYSIEQQSPPNADNHLNE